MNKLILGAVLVFASAHAARADSGSQGWGPPNPKAPCPFSDRGDGLYIVGNYAYRTNFQHGTCNLFWYDKTKDPQGNFIFADPESNTIRSLSPDGIITTILNSQGGTGPVYGVSPNGTPALTAMAADPRHAMFDVAGNIYFTDFDAGAIQMINKDGKPHFGIAMTAGDVYTIVGSPWNGGYSGDGGPSTSALITASHINLDVNGNLYISDCDNAALRMVPVASGTYFGQAMTANNIYTVAGGKGAGYYGDGGLAVNAYLDYPLGVVLDNFGNLIIADSWGSLIRRVDVRTNIITTIAGVPFDYSGKSTSGFGLAGNDQTLPPWYPPIDGFTGDDGPAVRARLNSPRWVEIDLDNNIYFSDSNNNEIRKINVCGVITAVAGQGGPWKAIGTGNVVPEQTSFSLAGIDAYGDASSIPGFEFFSPTNMSTPIVNLPYLSTVMCVAYQTVFFPISDIPHGWSQLHSWDSFYQVTSASPLAGTLNGFNTAQDCTNEGASMVEVSMLDPTQSFPLTAARIVDGNIVKEEYRILPDGSRTSVTFAGDNGPALRALLNDPNEPVLDIDGSVIFFDQGSYRQRMVPAVDGTYFGIRMRAGNIYTIAGNGSLGYWSGDGGKGIDAAL